MRAAIRGDFARLEQRLGVQELMNVGERTPAPEPDPPEVAQAVEPTPPSWVARLLAVITPRQV